MADYPYPRQRPWGQALKDYIDSKTAAPLNGVVPPTAVPDFIGQFYVDKSARKLYVALGATADDWTEVALA